MFGIDEAGRGSWAGPLVVVAVQLTEPITGLADSKQLTQGKRQELLKYIKQDNNIVITKSISARKIDELSLGGAMYLACEHLFLEISKLGYDKIVIDGSVNYLRDQPRVESLIKADAQIPECMAAGIIAKEERDVYMRRLNQQYPNYGFATNVGYGTRQHRQALEKHGLTPEHRRSYKPVQNYV